MTKIIVSCSPHNNYCFYRKFYTKAGFTTDRAAWVCCNTGSGSTDKWMHSGIFIVPPSKSAIMTSN